MDKFLALLLTLVAGLLVILVLFLYYFAVPYLLMTVLSMFNISISFWGSFMIVILFYFVVGVVKK